MWRNSRQPSVLYGCTQQPVCVHRIIRIQFAGRALPPSRWRRIASRKCEEPFRGDVNLVSSGSTLRGRFSGYSLVRLSQTTIVAVLHCKLTNRLVVKTCTMKMINEARSTLPGPLIPLGRRGELIVAGQVAMVTGHDGR